MTSPSTLSGTVALVTGASSGIGEATALDLASHGAAVAVVARRTDRLEDLAARIRRAGGTALVLTCDVTVADQARTAVEQTVAELGRLDTLVNNAGVMLLGSALSAPLEEWQRMVELNLTGLLQVTHAALPHLVAAAADSPRAVADLVNISSTAGRVVRLGSAVYNATKFGVGAVSESLRQELSSKSVRVSIVEPGATVSELVSHNRAEVIESLAKRTDGIERLLAEDIAEAVSYIVTRPRRVAINEMLVRPTDQEG